MSSTDRHTSPQKQTSRTQHRPHHHRAHRHHDAEDGDADKPTGMVTPLYMQQNGLKVLVRGRRKRKDDGALKRLAHWFVDNQIGLSVNLSALLFLTHASLPRARPYTRRFFTLSYPSETHPGQYGNGFDDAYLILYCLVLLTGLRASVMEYVLAPFAKWHGIERKKRITRFAEQGWLSIYATLSWGFGLYIYVNSSYFLNLKELWTAWPSREMSAMMKAYNLIQLAFWLHQIIVINIEQRRNDHYQMLTHHIITVTLIYSSYCYNHTRVGNLILVLMDIVDIFLPTAKCLRYLGYTLLCDLTFGAFMLSWFVARHVFYPMVCYSVWKHTPDILPHGCFRGGYPGGGPLEGPFPCPRDGPSGPLGYLLDPFLRPGRGVLCYDQVVKWFFLTALLALQVLLLIWLVTIVQVAVRVVRGAGAEDARSDDEGSDAETGDDVHDRHRVRLHGGVHDVDDAVSAAMASDAAEKRLPKAAGLGGAGSADAIALVDDYFGPAADQHQQKQPLEQEVGVEELDLKGWSERRNRRGGASGAAAGRPTTPIIEVPTSTSTGVSLPGHHSDRKELLGRIGCEKQVE